MGRLLSVFVLDGTPRIPHTHALVDVRGRAKMAKLASPLRQNPSGEDYVCRCVCGGELSAGVRSGGNAGWWE